LKIAKPIVSKPITRSISTAAVYWLQSMAFFQYFQNNVKVFENRKTDW
jgi:hypothetical protein